MPENVVDSVAIEIVGDAKNFAKNSRKQFEREFEKLDLRKLIREANGNQAVDIPVKADLDTSDIPEKVKKTRVPKVKVPLDPDTDSIPEKTRKTKVPPIAVPLDPLVLALREEVRAETARLSRQVIKLPVEGETGRLRAQLGAELAALKQQARLKVPVEPDAQAGYEAKLRAQLAAVSARVKQTVKVDVDVDGGKLNRGGGGGALLRGLTGGIPIIGSLVSSIGNVVSALQQVGGGAAQAGGQVVGAFSSAAGPIGSMVASIAVAAAAVSAFTIGISAIVPVAGAAAAAVLAIAGAAASLPGLLVGAGAGFGALSLGFKGISDAFKKKPGGGGGGGSSGGGGGAGAGEDQAARARRIAGAERGVEGARRGVAAATRGVAAAERGLEDAQRRVVDAQNRATQAQKAINKARADARERIEDLNRSLKGARLSEEDAALGVTEALRALNAAKETGVLPDIQRADLEYRQAQHALEEAKDATGDLAKETEDANRKGVEGSDEVQGALQDQRDAFDAVRDAQRGVVDAQDGLLSANDSLKASYDGLLSAQDALTEAQKKAAKVGGASGGGGGAGGALGDVVKLAPAAERFVAAVKALKPAFEALRLDVQQKLFAGLDKTVTRVGEAWIPRLRETLGNYATTFNGFFKNLGSAITKPKFMDDIQAGAESGRKAFEAIGLSITNSLVPAFGTLARAAGPFIERLGDEIAGVVDDFGRWIAKADDADTLESFFEQASDALSDMFDTGRQVFRLVGNIIQLIMNGDGKNNKSAVDSFNDGLESINQWFEDPANQGKISEFIDEIKGIGKGFQEAYQQAKPWLDKLTGNDADRESLADLAGQAIGAALVAGLIEGIKIGLKNTVDAWYENMVNGPISPIRLIREALGINSPSTVMMEIGGFMIDGLVKGITDKLGKVRDKAVEIRNRVTSGIGNAATLLKTRGQQFVGGAMTGISDRFSALRTRAGQIRTNVSNALSNAGTAIKGRGQQFVSGLITGIGERFANLRTRMSNLKTTITNALSNAGSLLIGAGRAVINGLIDGISRNLGPLGSYLRDVGTFIKNNKGPIEKDRIMLVPAGQAIMGGLIAGIGSQRRALGSELAGVTGQIETAGARIAAATLPDLGLSDMALAATADVQSSFAAHAEQRVVLEWAGTSDPLLRGIQSVVKLRYDGNVQKALGGR